MRSSEKIRGGTRLLNSMANLSVVATSAVLLLASLNLMACFHYPALATGICNPSGQLRYIKNELHPSYHCSPPIKGRQAHMIINSFAKGGDGGGPSKCDEKHHRDSVMIVALYNHGRRCLKNIKINANGKSAWKALGIPKVRVGSYDVTWSDE